MSTRTRTCTRTIATVALSTLLLPACKDGRTQPDDEERESATGADEGDDSNVVLDVGNGEGGSGGKMDAFVCDEKDFDLAAVPPNVVLVLDRSRSMVSESWDHDADATTNPITRWNSLHNVTSFVIDTFDEGINLGMTLFPGPGAEDHPDARACAVSEDVDVAVGRQTGAAIIAALPGAEAGTDEVFGATPAAAGVRAAHSHLQAIDPTVERAIVLVTDGAPNCNTANDVPELFTNVDTELDTAVAAAFADGIPTYVVGIDIVDEVTGGGGSPMVNTFELLNGVAESGGVARTGPEKFYNSNNEQDLQSALSEIAGDVVSCVIDFGETPEFPNDVVIHIDGVAYDEQVMDCASEDGWQYTSETFDQIILCGAACDALSRIGRLEVDFLCGDIG